MKKRYDDINQVYRERHPNTIKKVFSKIMVFINLFFNREIQQIQKIYHQWLNGHIQILLLIQLNN